jgi:hypothetical protein
MSFFVTNVIFTSVKPYDLGLDAKDSETYGGYLTYELTEPRSTVYHVIRLWKEATEPFIIPSRKEMTKIAYQSERVDHNLEEQTSEYRKCIRKFHTCKAPNPEIAKLQQQEIVLTKSIDRLNKTINKLQATKALIPTLQASISVLDNQVTVLTETLNEILASFKLNELA